MKPDWDKLGADFADSKTVIIADVDCTKDENKNLCSKYGVKGYPTVKYFTDATAPTGDPYEGGRDYNSLKTFADENLGPSCSWNNKDLCSAEKLKELEDAAALPQEERTARIEKAQKAIKDAEETFTTELEKLQASYKELMKNKEDTIAENSGPLKLYSSVDAALKKEAAGKDEL